MNYAKKLALLYPLSFRKYKQKEGVLHRCIEIQWKLNQNAEEGLSWINDKIVTIEI